jgi:hypothetical protein
VVVRVEEWRLGVSEQNRRGGACGSLRKIQRGGGAEEDWEVEVVVVEEEEEEECAKKNRLAARKHLKIEEKTSPRLGCQQHLVYTMQRHCKLECMLRQANNGRQRNCRSQKEAYGRNLSGEVGSLGLRTARARCLFQSPDFSRGKDERIQALGSGLCRVLLCLLVGLGFAAGSFFKGGGLVRVGSRCRAPSPRPARLARLWNLWHCRRSCSSLRVSFYL